MSVMLFYDFVWERVVVFFYFLIKLYKGFLFFKYFLIFLDNTLSGQASALTFCYKALVVPMWVYIGPI